jgi:hypothetical protein
MCWEMLMLAAALAAQAQPNFSGRWTLGAPIPRPHDAPSVLIVEQPVTRTNIRGEPMAPAFLRISIVREHLSGTTKETREIGIIGGTVGGVVTKDGSKPGPSSRYETIWRGDTLLFLDSSYGPDGPHAGDWSERSEAWSLDASGRLRVEIVSESHDTQRESHVFLYRRTQ